MDDSNFKVLTCNRCLHKWASRMVIEPKLCPGCKSPYWNKPRVRNRNTDCSKRKKVEVISKW